MGDTQTETAQTYVSEVARAIYLLCRKLDMPIGQFKREIVHKQKGFTLHPRQVANIFSEDPKSPEPTEPTLKKIRTYFEETSRLYVPKAYFHMSLSEKTNFLTKVNKFRPEFFSTYQIIRPFQNNQKAYALEAFEIAGDERGLVNLMYSHNFKERNKLKDEYYEGSVHVAERYYFSLLSRPHEKTHGDSAFRSIAFYIAEELEGDFNDFLFGLMLRGVSGEKAETRDYAVSTPFIAIPCNQNLDLRKIEPIDLPVKNRKNIIYRIHKDSSILLGEINETVNEKIFSYCKNIFENELIKQYLFAQNSLVLHSIPQRVLDTIGISKDSWEQCLKEAGIDISSMTRV